MKISIANAPVSWGIMEIGARRRPDPKVFLNELAQAGYTGTELGPYGYLPTDSEELRKELNDRSLTMVSAFVPVALKEEEADLLPMRMVAHALREAGAEFIILSDAIWPERDDVAGRAQESGVAFSEADWEMARVNLLRALGDAARYGLRCVFHHHAGTYIETPEEVERLLDLAPVGLCLDTGHYAYGGGDPVEAVRKYGKRIEHLHLKDVSKKGLAAARKNKLTFFDAVEEGVFCPLGQGLVRFPEFFRELESMGYEGWAVVEQDIAAGPDKEDEPLRSAIASREYLRRFGI
ncbi:MAG: TIM barrel protein [Acidimicrobiia bacterium]|nr:TIM barrel protein [Acidimicrobiia bacterium]